MTREEREIAYDLLDGMRDLHLVGNTADCGCVQCQRMERASRYLLEHPPAQDEVGGYHLVIEVRRGVMERVFRSRHPQDGDRVIVVDWDEAERDDALRDEAQRIIAKAEQVLRQIYP